MTKDDERKETLLRNERKDEREKKRGLEEERNQDYLKERQMVRLRADKKWNVIEKVIDC